MLDALVLADRAVEHNALLGVLRGAGERATPESHGFGGNQDALRVHAMQDVLEALALLADAVGLRDRHAIEEHLVGVDALAAELLDLAHLDMLAVEVSVEKREAIGGLAALLDRRGARE